MLAPLFLASGFFDIIDTMNDLSFVIRILVFSYFLFWLFITFRELPVIFGISVIGVAYLIFIAALPMIVLAIAFMVFLTPFGAQMQQMIQFGLMPALKREPFSGMKMPDQLEMQSVQEKIARGEQLNQREMEMAQEMNAQQQMQEAAGGGGMAARRARIG